MKEIKRKLAKLEEKFKISEKEKYENLLMDFFVKNGVPSVGEFITIINNRNRIESIESDFVKGLLARGGKEELLEVLDIGDKLARERQKLI